MQNIKDESMYATEQQKFCIPYVHISHTPSNSGFYYTHERV
jgi:hypothetical protein